MAHLFAIVKFPEEENSPRAIVPMKWVNEEAKTSFFFPNSTPYEKKTSMVVKQVDHGKDWPECPAIVMRKYATYQAARQDLPRSEETSNLESEDDEDRKRKRNKNTRLLYPGEEEESDAGDEGPPSKIKKVFPKLKTLVEKPKSKINALDKAGSTECDPVTGESGFLGINNVSTSTIFSSMDTEDDEYQRFETWNTNGLQHNYSENATEKSATKIDNEQLRQRLIRIESLLIDIVARMKSMEEKLNLPVAGISGAAIVGSQEDVYQLDPILELFPIENVESFLDIESKLKGDPTMQKKLMKIMITVGGKDMKNLTLNIIKRLMSDNTMLSFSYTGKKGFKDEKTESFGKTEICKNIHVAVRKVFKEASDEAIKKVLSGYLNQAKTRLMRKEQCHKDVSEKNRCVTKLTKHLNINDNVFLPILNNF